MLWPWPLWWLVYNQSGPDPRRQSMTQIGAVLILGGMSRYMYAKPAPRKWPRFCHRIATERPSTRPGRCAGPSADRPWDRRLCSRVAMNRRTSAGIAIAERPGLDHAALLPASASIALTKKCRTCAETVRSCDFRNAGHRLPPFAIERDGDLLAMLLFNHGPTLREWTVTWKGRWNRRFSRPIACHRVVG